MNQNEERALLESVLERMDRARRILTDNNPRPECNWGMLDTEDIRAALANQRAEVSSNIPKELDVRTILLDMRPSEDGLGKEVFAKSVEDVEKRLGDMGEELEDWRLGIRQYQSEAASSPLLEVLQGWRIVRNTDGSIGIHAPPPRPGESLRTGECVTATHRGLHELLGKLADHMQTAAQHKQLADWKWVPVEPTWDMKMAASSNYREPRDGHYTARMECAADAYRAMLAAAPPSPLAEQRAERVQLAPSHYDDDFPNYPFAAPPPEPQGSSRAELTVCKGMNCGSTDGVNHSLECHAEHLAAIAGGTFVKPAEQPRQMVALTDDEIEAVWRNTTMSHRHLYDFVDAAIAKFCEVNGINAPSGKE